MLLMFGGIGIGITSDSHTDPSAIFGFVLTAIFGFAFLIVVIALLSYLYQRWYFAVYFYDIVDDFIVIRKGPIAPKEITIPWERIQFEKGQESLLMQDYTKTPPKEVSKTLIRKKCLKRSWYQAYGTDFKSFSSSLYDA